MQDLLIEFKPQLLKILSFCTIPFITFLISLAHVYVWGRMLNVLKSDTSKNVLGFITLLGATLYYFLFVNPSADLYQQIWNIGIYTAIGTLFYVLLGFRFYDSIEKMIDKVTKTKNKTKRK
ncbi:MAG: hypothetical protein PF569_08175 [Candidatus Woesearchaeota archaeon]|jgi:hypothetical protein|nr:hypothetical protein [Candidatus Woesearchaeota archaeon]